MLSAMFSGRHALIKDAEGAHFIDRSPKWFDKVCGGIHIFQAGNL
jgi:hypothetical protein